MSENDVDDVNEESQRITLPDSVALSVFSIDVGTVIAERYTIVEKIADGAMAAVYRATDDRSEGTVALKILDPLRGADPIGRARFEREFLVLSKLSHPGIARCLRLERSGDLDVLVLEFVPGETLAARLDRGRLRVEESLHIATSLAHALSHCHAEGVLHRDLKPTNIILHPDRGPVILDFGVAWFTSAANLTRTGALVGSPQYMAPEVFASSLFDARADLYSLGAMLFEMLTGRPVHLSENVIDLVTSHQLTDPPSVDTLRPEIDANLAQIVARAVVSRPEARFATAREFGKALENGCVNGRRELQARLPCSTCSTPLIIDLPFCPGCGRDVAWELSPGPYAIQIDSIDDVGRCEAWLRARYGYALTTRPTWLKSRLEMTPAPLITSASRQSAERLASEAREIGCAVKVVRARTIIGARLNVAGARPREMAAAGALHLSVVATVGAALAFFGVNFEALASLPAVVGIVGFIPVRAYSRRPLLRCTRSQRDDPEWAPILASLRERLGELQTDRARRLTASAFARAAPALLGGGSALAGEAVHDVLDALERAVSSSVAVDVQAIFLRTRSRSRLAEGITVAKARAARCEKDTDESEELLRELNRLEEKRLELTEASLAHDLAARQALDACEAISESIRTFTDAEQARRIVTGEVWPTS